MEQALLSGATDLAGFRQQARALLTRRIPPEQVHWATADTTEPDLFAAPAIAQEPRPVLRGAATALVPVSFLRLVEQVILHRDPDRFALLYRLLWRLVHEPGLRHDPLDAQMLQAQQMAQAVRRDMHKMKAFVRFRTVAAAEPRTPEEPADPELHVAWFEPAHHIVEAIAPWFARRFSTMHWAILTPDRSVRWDGQALHLGPPARKQDVPPADAGELLWLTYYRSIFNPARLKLDMMRKEMPRRYWHNLPEATLITELTQQAAERSGRMVEQDPSQPERKMPQIVLAQRAAALPQPVPDRLQTLADVELATQVCRECPIGALATQAVVGRGPLRPGLMFVGEQPGDQEDLQGEPFVGPAGHLLDRALRELGIARSTVFVSNAVKHFKYELRGKRRIHKSPSQREAAACLHWLDDEIAIVQPRALVALGATAARSLLGRLVSVTAERGQWLPRPDGLQVLVTLHPSALLRAPDAHRDAAYAAWLEDLRACLTVLARP